LTDLATLGFSVQTASLKDAADQLDQFGARAKAAGAAVAQGADAAKVGTTATGIYAKAVNEAANAHGGLNTQAMAAFHAARSMAEGIAMGIPPAQMLAMQLNHLSYAASGPGGLVGAFQGALSMFAAMLTPMRLLVGGGAAVAGAFYLIYESIKTTELKFADLQDRIGGTLQSLHGLQQAAYLKGGVGQDDFLAGMEKFGSLVVEAQHGLGSMAELFRANGVSISKDLNVNLAKTADLVANAANQQEKYRVIVEAGLPPTQQWVQFLSQGGDAVLRASQQANGFGSAAEKAMIDKARNFDTQWERAWQHFKDSAKVAIIDAQSDIDRLINKAGSFVSSLMPAGDPYKTLAIFMKNGMGGTSLSQDDANKFYDYMFGKGYGPGGVPTGGKTTVNPQDVAHSLQVESQRISIMGQLASVEDQVRAKEIAIQQARLAGVPITAAQSKALLDYTRNEALGINAINAQTDAARIQAATIGMTTGQAQAYSAVMSKVYENIRLGHPLTDQQIADLKASAAAMGQVVDAAERVAQARDLTSDFFNNFGQALAQGKSGADALRSALQGLESQLIQMAAKGLANQLFGGLFGATGGGGGLFSGIGHLFGFQNGGSFVVPAGPGSFALPGFANGADFTVPGSGAPDSKVTAFRVSPGERVTVTPPGRSSATNVHISLDTSMLRAVVRDESGAVIANAAPAIIDTAVGKSNSMTPRIAVASARRTQLRGGNP
jgi:hypothetical protein